METRLDDPAVFIKNFICRNVIKKSCPFSVCVLSDMISRIFALVNIIDYH